MLVWRRGGGAEGRAFLGKERIAPIQHGRTKRRRPEMIKSSRAPQLDNIIKRLLTSWAQVDSFWIWLLLHSVRPRGRIAAGVAGASFSVEQRPRLRLQGCPRLWWRAHPNGEGHLLEQRPHLRLQ